MAAGAWPLREQVGSWRSVNPFQRHLGRLSQAALPAIAWAAPLPLAAMVTGDAADVMAPLFHHHQADLADLFALQGAAASVSLTPSQDCSLIYVAAGCISLTQEQQSFTCSAGGCLLVPPRPTHWRSTSFSVNCVLMSAEQIARSCGLIVPSSARSEAPAPIPAGFGAVELNHGPRSAALLKALERTLHTLSDCLDLDRSLITQLALEEQLCRLVALLMVADRSQSPSTDAGLAEGDCATDDFEALLLYIDAHLDHPLNLTLLQDHIHYSRRAVQYAFRRRLGCTATQWIRAQRLDRSRALLAQATAGDTVAAIAKACGYRSMSLFSIEFQQRFHIKPSILLRQARSESSPPGSA